MSNIEHFNQFFCTIAIDVHQVSLIL